LEKTASVLLCPPQIPHELTWVRTRAAVVEAWYYGHWMISWKGYTQNRLWPNLTYFPCIFMEVLRKSCEILNPPEIWTITFQCKSEVLPREPIHSVASRINWGTASAWDLEREIGHVAM
jgi:hypothetical protein